MKTLTREKNSHRS